MLLKWSEEACKSYNEVRDLLKHPSSIDAYDPDLPVLLATDGSYIGIEAVLSHKLRDGTERVIAYASRTLTNTEQKYLQIDKEALACVWGIQKFFYYLYARHFTLVIDNKPLTQIFHPKKSLPTLCIS